MARGQSTKIISMFKWIRTSRLSIKISHSLISSAARSSRHSGLGQTTLSLQIIFTKRRGVGRNQNLQDLTEGPALPTRVASTLCEMPAPRPKMYLPCRSSTLSFGDGTGLGKPLSFGDGTGLGKRRILSNKSRHPKSESPSGDEPRGDKGPRTTVDKNAFLQIFSTERRSVRLCWEKSKPQEPKGQGLYRGDN